MLVKRKTGKIDRKAKTNLMDRLDQHWRDQVRERDNWKCRKCGRKKNQWTLEAHHVAARRLMPTRWELLNGLSMCKLPCHDWVTNNPDEGRTWACEVLGEDPYNAVVTLARGVARYTMEDLEELLKAFKDGQPVSRVAEMLAVAA